MDAAARDMASRTPNAVMMEKSSVDEVDTNKLQQTALEHLSGLPSEHGDGVPGGTASTRQTAEVACEMQSVALRLASTWLGRCEKLDCRCGGDGEERALARASRANDRAADVDLDTIQFRLWELMETDASRVRYVVYPGRKTAQTGSSFSGPDILRT